MKEKDIRNLLAEKEGITELNEMQDKMLKTASEKKDIILLAPTGSGKTVAFGVPLIKMLKEPSGRVQAIVIAPSRELVVQIAGVLNNISGEYRVLALYGGHKVEDELNSLKVVPDIIVATPGRLLDHIKRGNIDVLPTRILVLDEFDKSLELGFEDDMSKIVNRVKNISRLILTSATNATSLPDFLPLNNPVVLDFLSENEKLKKRMKVYSVESDGKDKLDTLKNLLVSLSGDEGPERTIVFANHRESAERIYNYLKKREASCVLYHGALDQKDRESAIAAFNSGVKPILVATDLAARGLDIAGVKNVVHYHLPMNAETYTHRNGRTARMNDAGDVYLIVGPEEVLEDYINVDSSYSVSIVSAGNLNNGMELLYISSGKKEKLSKGDILGFLTKDVGLEGKDVGKIAVFDHYALVAVKGEDVDKILKVSRDKKIKGEKRRISLFDKR